MKIINSLRSQWPKLAGLLLLAVLAIGLFGCGGGGGGFNGNNDEQAIASRFDSFINDMERLSSNIGRNFANDYYNNCYTGGDVIDLINQFRAGNGWISFRNVNIDSINVQGNHADAYVSFTVTIGAPGTTPITDSVSETQYFVWENGTWLMLGNQTCRGRTATTQANVREKIQELVTSS